MKYLKEYFFLHLESNYREVPIELYLILLVLLLFAGIISFSSAGIRKGIHVFFVVALIDIVVLIFCATVFFREAAEDRGYNFLPLWSYSIESRDLQYSMYIENLMNVMMFIPFGIVLGCTFRSIRWKKLVVLSLTMSSLIEIIQFITKRGFAEVDDVIHNTLGSLVGFGIYMLVRVSWCKFHR